MRGLFKRFLICILILVMLLHTPAVIAQEVSTSCDTRFYWLYSSAIPAAWSFLSDKETQSVTVAVIDTGVDINNVHLQGRIASGGRNFVPSQPSNDIMDREGHGTAVAGLIAGIPFEDKLYYGAAGNLDISILPLKVYNDRTGEIQLNHVVNAIYYAIEMKVDVINISIDIPYYDEGLQKACFDAYAKSIVVVSSAGNNGDERYVYPSSSYGVISVSALSLYTENYYLSSSFSSHNDKVDISAQGENIYTLGLNNSYRYMNGSSFSCAIVAGAAAVMRAVNKGQSPYEIRTILTQSADQLSLGGRNNYYGYGKLNLLCALTLNLEDLIYQSPVSKEEAPIKPVKIDYVDNKKSISAGLSFGLWINKDLSVSGSGDTSFGKRSVASWKDIVKLASGDSFSIALLSNGNIISTGALDSGALDLSNFGKVKDISAGSAHVAAIRESGSLVAAGSNTAGQCNISSFASAISVECGETHTVVLRSNGTVAAAGSNIFGETNTSAWSKVVSVAAGNGFTLGLRSDGTVLATGNNKLKQIDVSAWRDIVEVFAGYDYSIGLKSDGTLLYTGMATEMSNYISTFTNVKTLACGRDMMILRAANDNVSVIGNIYAQQRSVNKLFVYRFDDIAVDFWAYPYINRMARVGIISGFLSSGKYIYLPSVYMTRQEFMKLIIEAMNIPKVQDDVDLSIFVDYENVAEWSEPYIKTAYDYGILLGAIDSKGNRYIKPDEPITRAEALTLLGRIVQLGEYEDISFKDTESVPEWALDSVSYFTSVGVLNGYTDNTIRANAPLYRSEAAAVICRIYDNVVNAYPIYSVEEDDLHSLDAA